MCNLHNPSLNEDLYRPYFFMMQNKNCYKILITTSISLNRRRTKRLLMIFNSFCVAELNEGKRGNESDEDEERFRNGNIHGCEMETTENERRRSRAQHP